MTTPLGFGLPDLSDSPTVEEIASVLPQIPGLHWDKQAWSDFLGSSKDAQLRDLKVLAASAQAPGVDTMKIIVKVLETIVVVAGGISGVSGAIAGIQSVKW